MTASELENLRRTMTEYNFAAQYQQDPATAVRPDRQARLAEVLLRA